MTSLFNPDFRRRRSALKQSGLGLPIAIFLITVLAALALNLGLLVQDNAAARSEQITLVRTLLAAESGAGFGLNRLFDPTNAPAYSGLSCSSSTVTYSLESDSGMSGCSAGVSCSSKTSGSETIYTITSIGSCDSLSRTVKVDVR
jgi:MSHA biogenesis protein MshP